MRKLKTFYKICLIKNDLDIKESKYRISLELAEAIINFLYSRYKRIPIKSYDTKYNISDADYILKNNKAFMEYYINGKKKVNTMIRISKNILKLKIEDENKKDIVYKYYLIKKK